MTPTMAVYLDALQRLRDSRANQCGADEDDALNDRLASAFTLLAASEQAHARTLSWMAWPDQYRERTRRMIVDRDLWSPVACGPVREYTERS